MVLNYVRGGKCIHPCLPSGSLRGFGGKYAVIMTINDYGEAVPELIMYCIVIPVFVVGLWHTLKLIKTVE